MKPSLIRMIAMFPLALIFLGAQGQASGSKGSPWKPFLSESAFKELTQQSIQVIEETAKSDDKHAHENIQVEASILMGYTLAVKNPLDEDVSRMRAAALDAARGGQRKNIKYLAEFSKTLKTGLTIKPDVQLIKPFMPEVQELMNLYLNKSKGGEGISVNLQYQPKLKKLNGGEALLGSLASKKLSEENMIKMASELRNFSYRTAVVGGLTHEYAPAKNADKWHDYSRQMQEAAIALAEAAQNKNSDKIMHSADQLQNACTSCHRDFKNK